MNGGGFIWHAAQYTPSGSRVATGLPQRTQAFSIQGNSAWQSSQIAACRIPRDAPQNTQAFGSTARSRPRPNAPRIVSSLTFVVVNGEQGMPALSGPERPLIHSPIAGFHQESVVT